MRITGIMKKRIIRRSVSLAVALAMLLNETYILSILDTIPFMETNNKSSQITAYAAEETGPDPNFTHDANGVIRVALADFVEYSAACQVYSTYHQNDKVKLYSIDGSDVFETGFSGLGTESKPFGGSLEIESNTYLTLNLDAPLFNYVYDSVTINNGNVLHLSRYYGVESGADKTAPIVAKYVYKGSSSDVVTWNIDLTTPSDSTDHYLSQFSGFIGTMAMDDAQRAPKLALNVTMNTASMTKNNVTKNDNRAVAINGNGDLGLACGHMDEGAELTFTYTANRAISGISTTGGDVGGLVGEMERGSVFTLINENAVTSGIDITTTAGSSYAGGLVGRNVGGTVNVKDSSSAAAAYTVTQHMTGTSGAGGVYGYYSPASALTGNNAFDTSKYSVDCQVNGTGNTGGLFGVLDVENDVTISGASTVTSKHASGDCTAYGGLIGQYKADNVSRTLTVNNVSVDTSKSGSSLYYGGGIGEIENTFPTYVEFNSFTAAAANAGALTFGGLAANADKAFVKANGVSVTASGYKGGGLVGTLADGVLQISGTNTITGSSSEPGNGENLKVGKIVGYRDNGLVFMDAGASCTCGEANVDDVGSWGGVIKLGGFTSPANVLSVSGHAVTIGTDNYAFTPISDADDFAVTALRFQVDGSESANGNQFVTFANDTKDSSNIATSDIDLTGTVDLTGTGVYGLTRDNDIGSAMAKCVYSAAFGNANTAQTITFDTGTIYRHKYNGLFAKLDGGTVRNVVFGGTIRVNAKTDMYVGTAAARATGDFSASNVTVSTAMPYGGGSTLYIGGILGKADSSIGSIAVSNCSVAANITGGNDKAVIGGVIGQISHNSDATRAWGFDTVTVSGKISNTASGKLGGLAGIITGSYNNNTNNRVLTLKDVTVNGLEVSGSGSEMGGLLGYSWLKTDVNVTSVTVQDNSDDTSKKPTVENATASGDVGGMVYRATGKWTVASLDIQDIKITGTGSVGMIVNKGISHDDGNFYTQDSRSAIYLCLPSGYTYNITSATLPTVDVFDELCAYTAPNADSVLRNGNGVISINTTFKTDGTTASGSYHAQTAKGASANPNSRYYYNLDTVTASSSSNEILTYNESTNPNAYKNQLMSWGLNQYACTNIKKNFADPFDNTITDHTYDMNGYSWYPVDLDKNITVNGTFKFYSHEFELSEDAKASAETAANSYSYDRTNLEKNQHYTMHCGLFRNVSNGKTLTVGTTVFQGDVGLLGGGSGALICGTVQGGTSTSKAAVTVTGSVSLDGIYVCGAGGTDANYAPLLINKVGNYADMKIANVSSTNKYQTSADVPYISYDGTYPKAASSLIGDVGLSDAPTGINISFGNIRLDGRTADVTDSTFNTELDLAYGTQRTLFTRSTLLNQFKYASGSTGKYDYTSEQDWDNEHHYSEDGSNNKTYIGVTYGQEVGYTDTDTSTEYPGKEQKYSGSSYYTNPVVPAATSAYTGFGNFLPYVYISYNKNNNTHQLRVNHAASTATGCGTYNDPYILSSGEKLEDFCKWINKGEFNNGDKICIPASGLSNTAIPGTWCNNKDSHVTMTFDGTNSNFTGTVDNTTYTISLETMRTYLAGAYYKIPDEVSEITVQNATFDGLGNTQNDYAVFRGVIDGNNRKIVNKTEFPLIESSNGSVVKDLTVEAVPDDTITRNGQTKAFGSQNSTDYNVSYGAVIGKVLGGDNIIDNVSVSLGTESSNMNIALTGNYAQLVPVGGYVGVVVNGGLIFRNMSRVDGNDNPLTYDEDLFSNVSISAEKNSNKSPQTAISDDNRAWLYVNPIVGRVINGYAVTESDKYRPYEDGTRTYKGGTTDEVRYWNENQQKEVTTEPSALSHVTMQNGTKHYSIADIDKDLGKLSAADTTVSVPNGQAWFVMSLLVNSGESADTLGFKQNYQMSRQAKYTNIGTSDSSAACSDYNDLAKDDKLTNKKSSKKGYLYNAYYSNTVQLHNNQLTVELSKVTYYLPDGYKGIGNMYNHDDATTTNSDENDNYRMQITNFEGNGATVSMNSSWYFYYADSGSSNALTKFDTSYAHYSMVGFGLFNYQTGKTDKATNTTVQSNRYYNFILTGNVVADCINSNSNVGNHITYIGGLSKGNWTGKYNDADAEYADSNYMPAVGSLIGYATNTTYTDSVALQNVYVKGLRNTGGLIGMTSLATFTSDTSDPKFTYENTKSTPSNKIKVHGAATTGGMIGKNQQSIVYIDNGNATYSLTEVKSECTKVNNNQQNYGVGGFVGMCRAADSSKVNRAITVKKVKVGSPTQDSPSEISATADLISVGGVVGTITRAKVSIEECYVYNQSIKSAYSSGGMIGYWATPTDGSEITNVTIYAKDYGSAEKNPVITSSASSGAAGGFIGNRLNENAGVSVYIRNSNVSGYTIGGTALSNAGGAIGEWNGGTVNLQNVDISSCKIIAKSSGGYAGGLVGSQKTNNIANQNSILGYNILLKNLDFTGQYKGNILGRNTDNNQVIKLSGFSRQDDQSTSTMIPALVGNPNASKPYGTDGYVIFADYTDKASTVQNKDHANMYACEDDVIDYSATGSKTTVTNYTVIAQKVDGESIIRNVTQNGDADVSTSETPSENPGTSVSGYKTGYVDVAGSEASQITSLNSIKTGDDVYYYIKGFNNNYISGISGASNAHFTTTSNETDALIWHFEPVDSEQNIYYIYTIDDGKKYYISRNNNGYINLYSDNSERSSTDSQWDRKFQVSVTDDGYFQFYLTEHSHTDDKYRWLSTDNVALQDQTQPDKPNNNAKFTIYEIPTGEQLTHSTFTSTSAVPSTNETISGTLSNSAAVSSSQQTDYENALVGFDDTISEDDHSYEVYTITETVVENTYEYGKNKSPYVTTNPKFNITNGQFLTGDGVSAAAYSNSAFRQIVDERAANTDKSYQFYTYLLGDGETADVALANIRSELSTSSNEYKGYFAQHEDSGIKNFPLLVAEDTNRVTLTRMINNYLRALTNTNYNFADQTKSAVFEVGLYKCTFNESKGAFDVDTTGACLENRLINNEYFFYMDAGNVDTKDIPQFTLLDVKFKDPANINKIAYHLFVPVYVKKVLRYAFNAEIKSGTDYYWSAYSKLGSGMSQQGMFENLGNPVTIAFEFAYDRKPAEWVSALNGGDSLLTNYYKSLNLKNHNENGWADDTKMVLVDANNSDKYYYLDSPPAERSTSICLYDFKDDAQNHYTPVNLQELMTVTVGKDSEGTLTPTNENTSEGATVFDGTTYYRPIRDDENVAEADRYTVTSVSEIKPERYYLSIFTKADDTNNAVYRYEISSPESFAATGTGVTTDGTWTVDNWRANKINDKNTVINLFTGKLYENKLDLDVTPKQNGTLVMSAANNFLNVDMKATVELTENAKDSGVGNNMYTFKNNAAIYQTFLMMYDKLATLGGSHEIGIDMAAKAKVGINSYYFANGIVSDDLTAENAKAVSNLSSKKVESAKYIELRNEQNLIEMLGSGSNAVTLQVKFDMVYAADDLSTQFPKKDPDDNTQITLGTKVIGYSKIASTVESAANSATYIKITDNDLYYTTTESTASLTYNVQLTPESSAGQYSYLGINSVETGVAEMFVDTYAVYDAHRLTSPGDYIELTLTLSDKGEGYVTPTAGTPIPTGENAGKALNISDYLTELKIYGADVNNDGEDDVIFDQSAAEVSAGTRVTKKGDTLYTVRVKKDLLKTKSDDVYVIPITYNVKTGNTLFNSTGKKYSNYKVSLTAATYSSISGSNYSKPSYAFDHIIYTNARVLTSVVN